jgi:hypothetical protein
MTCAEAARWKLSVFILKTDFCWIDDPLFVTFSRMIRNSTHTCNIELVNIDKVLIFFLKKASAL